MLPHIKHPDESWWLAWKHTPYILQVPSWKTGTERGLEWHFNRKLSDSIKGQHGFRESRNLWSQTSGILGGSKSYWALSAAGNFMFEIHLIWQWHTLMFTQHFVWLKEKIQLFGHRTNYPLNLRNKYLVLLWSFKISFSLEIFIIKYNPDGTSRTKNRSTHLLYIWGVSVSTQLSGFTISEISKVLLVLPMIFAPDWPQRC